MLRRLLFGHVLKEIEALRRDFNELLIGVNSLLAGHSRLLILLRTNQFKDKEEIMATLLDVLAAEGRLAEAIQTQGESTLLVIDLIKAEALKIQDALKELADLHSQQGQVKPEDLAQVKGKIDDAVGTIQLQTAALKQVIEQFSQPAVPAPVVQPPVVVEPPAPESPVVPISESVPEPEPVIAAVDEPAPAPVVEPIP